VPFDAAKGSAAVSEYLPVATLDEIPPGERKIVTVGRREIAIFNVAGTLYAIENLCPHQGGPLGEGWLDGMLLTCPWHGWCFDLESGAMTLGDFSVAETFDVRTDGSIVLVASEPARPAREAT
jgi:nitrite reductase/ring-hydroxylating ferredoxin subunit